MRDLDLTCLHRYDRAGAGALCDALAEAAAQLRRAADLTHDSREADRLQQTRIRNPALARTDRLAESWRRGAQNLERLRAAILESTVHQPGGRT